MPSTATHDAIGLITSLPITGSALLIAEPGSALVFGATYVVSTLVLSPDLDWGKNGKQGRVAARWGLLSFIWAPYHWIVPHRSRFSHSAIGGLLRFVYVILVLGALLTLAGLRYAGAPLITNIFIPMALGCMLSSLVHSVTDNISTGWKRSKRRRL